MKMILRAVLLSAAIVAPAALAEPAWVSDQFEIMLRSGPSTSNAIQLMVDSGTRLEVVERDAQSGYSRVRTSGGTEGWVLTRYLMSEPSAREQLQTLTGQLTNANSRGSSLDSQLTAIRSEYDSANNQIRQLGPNLQFRTLVLGWVAALQDDLVVAGVDFFNRNIVFTNLEDDMLVDSMCHLQ